ncbi:LOW QUALITY PROTEIN: hypothetical protein ACHAWF_003089, partial [Thalassiosira exigua]
AKHDSLELWLAHQFHLPPDPNDPDLKRRTKVYQSVVGCLNWLTTCTCPDLAPDLTFLASYMQAPSVQHYRSVTHALKYTYLTAEYGISFPIPTRLQQSTSSTMIKRCTRMLLPRPPPNLMAYSKACWGEQFSNTIPNGTPVKIFEFHSLSCYLICRCGGPMPWRSIRYEQTALSSCEAEIIATNECIVHLLSICHRMADLGMPDTALTTYVYKNNRGAVDWSKNIMNKGIKHFNPQGVRKVHTYSDASVTHIPGEINSSDIFTKDMKDAAHVYCISDSFMVLGASFLRFSHTVPAEVGGKTPPFYSPTHVSDKNDGNTDVDEICDDADGVTGGVT